MIASFVVYATFINPEYKDVFRLRGELASALNILEETRNSNTQVQNLIAQYQKDEKDINALALILPRDESISSLIAQINTVSQSSGVVVRSIGLTYLSIKPPAVRLSFAKGTGILRLDLRFLGSYSSMKRFLEFLENNIRLMDVRSLRMDPLGDKPGEDLFNYSLIVDTYYQAKLGN